MVNNFQVIHLLILILNNGNVLPTNLLPFPGQHRLNRHERIHQIEKLYNCVTCKKVVDPPNFNHYEYVHSNFYFDTFRVSTNWEIIVVTYQDIRKRKKTSKKQLASLAQTVTWSSVLKWTFKYIPLYTQYPAINEFVNIARKNSTVRNIVYRNILIKRSY